MAVDPDLTLAPLAAPPQANRDCEHKVIMRASARLVSGSAGIGDMTAKVLKLLAQRFTLAQLVGEAQRAIMQARVDAGDQQRLGHAPTPEPVCFRCINAGGDRHAYWSQPADLEQIRDGSADSALVDDEVAVIVQRRPAQHLSDIGDDVRVGGVERLDRLACRPWMCGG